MLTSVTDPFVGGGIAQRALLSCEQTSSSRSSESDPASGGFIYLHVPSLFTAEAKRDVSCTVAEYPRAQTVKVSDCVTN